MELKAKLISVPVEAFANTIKAEAFKQGGIERLQDEDPLKKLVGKLEEDLQKLVEMLEQK